jgi:hypothetical protein
MPVGQLGFVGVDEVELFLLDTISHSGGTNRETVRRQIRFILFSCSDDFQP